MNSECKNKIINNCKSILKIRDLLKEYVDSSSYIGIKGNDYLVLWNKNYIGFRTVDGFNITNHHHRKYSEISDIDFFEEFEYVQYSSVMFTVSDLQELVDCDFDETYLKLISNDSDLIKKISNPTLFDIFLDRKEANALEVYLDHMEYYLKNIPK